MPKGAAYHKSFQFSLDIIGLYQKLVSQKEYILSKQLLRSATSIGANINEASAAQSKRDFVSKMTIASKEARETLYWLELLETSRLVDLDYSSYIHSATELVKLLTAILKTCAMEIESATKTKN